MMTQPPPSPLDVKTTPVRAPQKSPLRILLVLAAPLVLVTLLFSGVTWQLLASGRKAANDLANNLQAEATARILQQLTAYLETPHQLNSLNRTAYARGDIDVLGGEGEHHFWQQAKVFPATNLIYCGSQAEGAFLSVGPAEDGGGFELSYSNPESALRRQYYRLDSTNGRRVSFLRGAQQPYDPRQRPWYRAAIASQGAAWSEIYLDFDTQLPAITASVPVYTTDGETLGVCATDFLLSRELNQFLASLEIGESGQTFIVDRATGNLVATSTGEALLVEQADEQVLVSPQDSRDRLVSATAAQLLPEGTDWSQIDLAGVPPSFEIDGDRHLLQVVPYSDERGIDWLVAVVVPEADFLGQIERDRNLTIGWAVFALVLAVGIGVAAVRWIERPVRELSNASQAIARGDLDRRVESPSRVRELFVLAGSFNQMAQQLQASFSALQTTNEQLEARVAERTAQLETQERETRQENQVLQEDIAHLLDVVLELEEGNLTVAARVSDRATGLVADTLNRLIEALEQIVASVLATTQQLGSGSGDVEQMAISVAENARQQSEALDQVRVLMARASEVAEQTQEQAAAAEDIIRQARGAVERGQEEVTSMSGSIKSLQEYTDIIVRRSQTLSEFVQQAVRFSQTQKRLASLTRVLALNASTIAARASRQPDPTQFASIAREFETVAKQVNDLAVETNESLGELRRRTDRIQTVVSGLNQNIYDTSELVQAFTQGVERSSRTFSEIETATAQVAEIGQQVTRSGQTIAESAQSTRQAMESVATLARETTERSDLARQQVSQMRHFTQLLQKNVAFFRLRKEATGRKLFPDANTQSD